MNLRSEIMFFLSEWKIRFLYWVRGKKIIVKNKGLIQWDDFSFIYRFYWPYIYDLEEMENFRKELKDGLKEES